MDSNSRRFPLDLYSLNVDMSSEDKIEENTSLPPGTAENEQPANPVLTAITATQTNNQEVSGTSREAPTPTPSTEESVSAYVERTLQELGQQSEMRFLPTPEAEKEIQPLEQEVPKASVSDAIIKAFTKIESVPDDELDIDRPDDDMSETSRLKSKADFFQTDTSEV